MAGADRAEVTLAQYPALGPLGATVIVGSDWAGAAQDSGDVAVLQLDQPVTVAPAKFAAADAAFTSPGVRLTAYGFPRNYDEGILSEFRVTSNQLIAGEWIQLESWTSHGQPLREGFSGSAILREDTGEVIGMATSTSGERGGRMLPAQALARYWPGAAELVSVPGYSPEEVIRLRDLVLKCAANCAPEAAYQRAMGPLAPPPPTEGFLSLWDVAWFLLTEVPPTSSTGSLSDFVTHLAHHTQDPAVQRTLYAWAAEHRPETETPWPTAPPVPNGGPRWSPILVEVEHSGADRDAYLVSVFVIRDGRARLVSSDTRARPHVQEYVRANLDTAFRQIDRSGDELIAFALPRDWLGEPVDQWQTSADDPTPLGCSSPVVVMDLSRRRQPMLQFKIEKAWQALDDRPGTTLHRVECGSRQDPHKLTVQLKELKTAVGYGAPPDDDRARGLLHAGLNAAVPVIVWPRSGCSGGQTGSTTEHACSGSRFLDALQQQLSSLRPSDLPRHVRKLRSEAFMAEAPELHWASDLTLFWEDPRWFPEAHIYLQSPVS